MPNQIPAAHGLPKPQELGSTEMVDHEPVVILTCGRSGSTLLLRIMNCLPHTIVWGEHGGVLSTVLESYRRLTDVASNAFVLQAQRHLEAVLSRTAVLADGPMSIEWLNWFGSSDIDSIYRRYLDDLFLPAKYADRFSRWGFKEIRYGGREYATLRRLYPRLKLIVLVRSPLAVMSSQYIHFAGQDPERFAHHFGIVRNFYQFAADMARGEDDGPCLFLSYRGMVTNFDGTVAALSAFVGEGFLETALVPVRDEVDSFRGTRVVREDAAGDTAEATTAWVRSLSLPIDDEELRGVMIDYADVRPANDV